TDPAMPEHIALEWPEWLMADAKAGLGDGLARELATLMTEAPTDVRINPLKQPDKPEIDSDRKGIKFRNMVFCIQSKES
uniref:hypothetical protein n=1 Tax=Winogradskyella sp. TaxID=1883156 RepID=UPI003512B4D5